MGVAADSGRIALATFLKTHVTELVARDLFTVPTV
jgi:hypothetical protein